MFQREIQDDVYLQLLEERHAPAAFEAVDRDRAHLGKWLPWVDQTTEVDYTASFIKSSLEQFANNEGLAAGIWCGDEFIGGIGTHKIDWLNRRVEIGYWIASRFQGRGIVTAACRVLIDHAFGDLQHEALQAGARVSNPASRRVLEKCAFQ